MARGNNKPGSQKLDIDVLQLATDRDKLAEANKLANALLAGSGTVTFPKDTAGTIMLSAAAKSVLLQSKDGTVADLSTGNVTLVDSKGKAVPTERTVTVQVIENGIGAVKMAGVDGVFRPVRGKAEVTPEQQAAILNATPVKGPQSVSMAEVASKKGVTIPASLLGSLDNVKPLTLENIGDFTKVKEKAPKAPKEPKAPKAPKEKKQKKKKGEEPVG